MLKNILIIYLVLFVILLSGCEKFIRYAIVNGEQKSEYYCIVDSSNKVSYEFSGTYGIFYEIHTLVKISIKNNSNYDLIINDNLPCVKSKYFNYVSRNGDETEIVKKNSSKTVFYDFDATRPEETTNNRFKMPADENIIFFLKGVSLNGNELKIEPIKFVTEK